MFNFLEGEAVNTTGSTIMTVVMLVAMVALFYFFMYRPQKKQEKETNAMRDSLEVGDEITTIGGIIGKIVSIKDETVLIETGRDKVRIRIRCGCKISSTITNIRRLCRIDIMCNDVCPTRAPCHVYAKIRISRDRR